MVGKHLEAGVGGRARLPPTSLPARRRDKHLEAVPRSRRAGGLDGIARKDALGLDTVGVQAKRYDPHGNPVQRPDLQAFVEALQGAQTTRGVFVTTGRFTQGARDYAASVGMRIVLGWGWVGAARRRVLSPATARVSCSGRRRP